MATPTSFISIEDKKEVAMSLAMHFLVYKTKAGLDQLKEGLGKLGILQLIHQYHNQLKPLFLATGKPPQLCCLCLKFSGHHKGQTKRSLRKL